MSQPSAALSRADLLRALGAVDGDPPMATRLAALLQFAPRRQMTLFAGQHLPPAVLVATVQTGATPTVELPPRADAVLQTPLLAVVERRPAKPQPEIEPLPIHIGPPDPTPRQPGAEPPFKPLLRAARLWPALRQTLSTARPAGIDWPALQRQLSSAQVPQRLPRGQRQQWADQLWIVADMGQRCVPFQGDMRAIVQWLARVRGAHGLALLGVASRPDQGLSLPALLAHHPQYRRVSSLPVPPAGTTVLLLSDCGLLARQPHAEHAWLDYARRAKATGARVLAWAPVSPGQVSQSLARAVEVHCLSPQTSLQAQPGRLQNLLQRERERHRLEALLPRLRLLASCCVWLEPPLLRSIRWIDPVLRAEPALESLYWADDTHVSRSRVSRALTPQAAAQARPQLASLPLAQRLAVFAELRHHHAGRPRSTEVIEASLLAAHCGLGEHEIPPDLAIHLRDAKQWLHTLGASASNPSQRSSATASYARDLLARQAADTVWQAAHADEVAALWAITGQTQAPAGVDAARLLQAKERLQPEPARHWNLVQRGNVLWLWPAEVDMPRYASMVEPGRRTAAVIVRGGAGGARWIAASDSDDQGGLPLFDTLALNGAVSLTLDDGELVVALRRRPAWATEWGRDIFGLFAYAPVPWHGRAKLWQDAPNAQVRGAPPQSWHQTHALEPVHATLPEWKLSGSRPSLERQMAKPAPRSLAVDDGNRTSTHLAYREVIADGDLAYNLLTKMEIGHRDGRTATQTFRYLPPGDFWMGSHEEEGGRYNDESPRHRVRLSQGFWLADTACTQTLWLAVMGGKNPSHFQGDDQRPVEDVSFDQVQTFLSRLQALLPGGCEAVLPTEAQWEYACRAGSDTAFNTGATLSRAQANFDAADDTSLAPRGEVSQGRVPVKSFAPNAWGLHEMHGNVWEWCDDYGRDYAGTAIADGVALDPAGQRDSGPEARRAVRGGSWFDHAGNARSACRLDFQRGYRLHILGFRFALRSTSQEGPEGQVLVSGPEGRALGSGPQGRQGLDFEGQDAPLADRRDADPPSLLDRLPNWLRGKRRPAKKPGNKP